MIGLKKNFNLSVADKKKCIELGNPMISISRQCELLDLPRSSYYYHSDRDDSFNELLMKLIDEKYTKAPFYGVPRMTVWLRLLGHDVNVKRIRRLMHRMGIQAIYPKPHLSRADEEHKKYPYLLRGMDIHLPDQVWGTDITYIRMNRGFVYLVAIMDWFSRYVLSWEISTTLDREFCIQALDNALKISKPEIFNTDQGSQFTSIDFTDRLKNAGIRISMDGRGRAYDNIFVERLWRTVKYEEVYLHDYRNVLEAKRLLAEYFRFYNTERNHQALNYRTPHEVYFKEPFNQALRKVS